MPKTFMICIVAIITLMSCVKDDVVLSIPPVNDTLPAADTTKDTDTLKTFLALGDSYTIGQSVPVTARYPVQTVKLLNETGIKFSDPEIIAQTGWTTGNLLNRLNSNPPLNKRYDIVTLLIGVNNQYQRLSQVQYRSEFTTLLNQAIQYANNDKSRVIVLSIPDYSVTPFAASGNKELIAGEIDAFNAINKEIAVSEGVNYLEITASTRMAATDPALIAPDGLHPSGKEYAKWASSLVPVIATVLH